MDEIPEIRARRGTRSPVAGIQVEDFIALAADYVVDRPRRSGFHGPEQAEKIVLSLKRDACVDEGPKGRVLPDIRQDMGERRSTDEDRHVRTASSEEARYGERTRELLEIGDRQSDRVEIVERACRDALLDKPARSGVKPALDESVPRTKLVRQGRSGSHKGELRIDRALRAAHRVGCFPDLLRVKRRSRPQGSPCCRRAFRHQLRKKGAAAVAAIAQPRCDCRGLLTVRPESVEESNVEVDDAGAPGTLLLDPPLQQMRRQVRSERISYRRIDETEARRTLCGCSRP
jgi:hypothetical protein